MTDISQVSSLSKQVIAEVERAVVGKRALLEMMMASMLAGGHMLLEDFPGLGKTLVARSFATVLGLEFKRIQFTPDLLPGDITGGISLTARKMSSSFAKVRSLRISCLRTRSTAPHRKPSLPCWRPCRRAR